MNTHDIDLPPLPDEDGYMPAKVAGHAVELNAYRPSTMEAYARAAIEADRKTTEKQLTAYRGLVNSLEARLAHLQAQHDELKKSTNPDLLASERAANAMLTEELEADRKRRGEPVAGSLFAVYLRDNWDGEGDMYWVLARIDENGKWVTDESGKPLLAYEGDAVLRVTLLEPAPQPAEPQPTTEKP